MKTKLTTLIAFLFVANVIYAADIIPQPRSVVEGKGTFELARRATLVCDKELNDAATYLLEYLPLRQVTSKDGDVRLVLDKKMQSEEYLL